MADVETLWSVAVPRPNGDPGETFIPAVSREHAEGMASRMVGLARVAEWPHSREIHEGMIRGMTRLFGDTGMTFGKGDGRG